MRDYRNKIDFLKKKVGPNGEPLTDDYGELIDEWDIFKGGVWASKDPLLGNEFSTALTTENKVEVKFNMRYVPGITSEMRIKHGKEVYEIVGPPINIKSLNRELLCYCKMVK